MRPDPKQALLRTNRLGQSPFSFYDPFLGLPGQPWQAANIPRGDHERHGSIPSWPGLTRPSIIPSKGACEALDARIKSGHDEFARVSTSRSRGALRPSFSKFETAQKQRAQGMPGVWLARSLACKQRKHTSKSPQVHRNDPAFPARLVLTAASCSCVCKIWQNVRTGGSHQPPVAGSEPDRARRPQEPVGERGTGPVSSSTRTVARALSPNRARKGVG